MVSSGGFLRRGTKLKADGALVGAGCRRGGCGSCLKGSGAVRPSPPISAHRARQAIQQPSRLCSPSLEAQQWNHRKAKPPSFPATDAIPRGTLPPLPIVLQTRSFLAATASSKPPAFLLSASFQELLSPLARPSPSQAHAVVHDEPASTGTRPRGQPGEAEGSGEADPRGATSWRVGPRWASARFGTEGEGGFAAAPADGRGRLQPGAARGGRGGGAPWPFSAAPARFLGSCFPSFPMGPPD